MPQLMPLWWWVSVFTGGLVVMMVVFFYWEKNKSEVKKGVSEKSWEWMMKWLGCS